MPQASWAETSEWGVGGALGVGDRLEGFSDILSLVSKEPCLFPGRLALFCLSLALRISLHSSFFFLTNTNLNSLLRSPFSQTIYVVTMCFLAGFS